MTKTVFLIKSARCAVLALLLSLAAPGAAKFVPEASRDELTAAAAGNKWTAGFWFFRRCIEDPCPGPSAYCCGPAV